MAARAARLRGAERPKSLITLWLAGGPSQLETWDPHPEAKNGGPTQAIDTRMDGLQIAHTYPLLAEQIQHLNVIRSLATPDVDRTSAGVGALWARAKIASHMDELARGAPLDEVKPRVVKVALEHHLVSAYTSLVAVDVTPTGPTDGLKSAMVKTSLPHAFEANLPQTDTAATLQLLLGLLALIAAAAVMWVGRHTRPLEQHA